MFSRQQPSPGAGLYDSALVQPMRDEVTRLGVTELRTPEDVEQALKKKGTALVFVNSVCGCAAAGARPGLTLALTHKHRPEHLFTVFAGMEREAVAQAREHFKPYQPSSPQIALLKDGKVVFMMQRHDIEGRDPQTVAAGLAKAFDEHCKKP
jgi:putative YphP/YqiW family bacilliredoxin